MGGVGIGVRSRAKKTAAAVVLVHRVTHDYFTLSSKLVVEWVTVKFSEISGIFEFGGKENVS